MTTAIYAFDLDNTLVESTHQLDNEMTDLLLRLLGLSAVAIVSGAPSDRFMWQLRPLLDQVPEPRDRLLLFPNNVTEGADLSPEQVVEIEQAITYTLHELGIPATCFGPKFLNRGGQVVFSGLGEYAPYSYKVIWDPDFTKRRRIQAFLAPLLPEYDVTVGGTTSIDITPKGRGKALLAEKLGENGFLPEQIVYVADALWEGGNDCVVVGTGVECVPVGGPEDTKWLIRGWVAEMAAGCPAGSGS